MRFGRRVVLAGEEGRRYTNRLRTSSITYLKVFIKPYIYGPYHLNMKELTEPGTLIAIAAFIVSMLAFLQSRKLPNENKIFEEKIKVYHELIWVMNATVNEIFGCINEFAKNEKSKTDDREELEDDLNGALDDAIYALEDAITDNALVIPDKLVDKLSDFLELLDREEYLNTYADRREFEKLDEELEDAFNRIIDAMRKDLDFDILNKGLRSRIRGHKRLRFLTSGSSR